MSKDWEVVMESSARKEDARWYATHIEGVEHDVAYRYDAYTREAYTRAPRATYQYVSAEHARRSYLGALTKHSTARAIDFEQAMMRIQGGERGEPDYERLVDLQAVFEEVLRRAPLVLATRKEPDLGRAKLWLWWDFAWRHAGMDKDPEVKGPTPEEIREIRLAHNARIKAHGWDAPSIHVDSCTPAHQQIKSLRKRYRSWCAEVDRLVVHELVKRSMYIAGAVDRDK